MTGILRVPPRKIVAPTLFNEQHIAWEFDAGSSQYMRVASAPVVTTPFTMATWFNSSNVTSNWVFFNLNHGNNDYANLVARGGAGGDPVRFEVREDVGGGSSSASTSSGYIANKWHHALGIQYATNSRASFIDGGSKGTNAVAKDPTFNATVIGAQQSGAISAYFSGGVFLPAIWDVALTDEEVWRLGHGALPWTIRSQNLRACWMGQNAMDVVGNYHMTKYNGPTLAMGSQKVQRWVLPRVQGFVAGAPPVGNAMPMAMNHYRRRRAGAG